MLGRFAEDTQYVVVTDEHQNLRISFAEGDVNIRSQQDDRFQILGTDYEPHFIISDGIVYVRHNYKSSKILDQNKLAIVVESPQNLLHMRGFEDGFGIISPARRKSTHTTEGTKYLQVGGVVIEAINDFLR